jgi:hypothetical protein
MIGTRTLRWYSQSKGEPTCRQADRAARRRRSRLIAVESLEVRALLSIQGLPTLLTEADDIAKVRRDGYAPDQVQIAQVQPDTTDQAMVATDYAEVAALVAPVLQFNPNADRSPFAIPVVQESSGGSPAPQFNPNADRGPFAIPTVQPSVPQEPQPGDLTYSTKFDLRPAGYVSPVKDQGACGSCWAFATYASLESSILKSGGPTMDFSENHLKDDHGFNLGPCDGGNIYMSQAYLSRWDGPVSEADDPYRPYDDRPSPGGQPQCYVRDMSILDTSPEIKDALINFGALHTSMAWEDW